jgi:hypothetical protein
VTGQAWLDGPRGRELCLLVAAAHDPRLSAVWHRSHDGPTPDLIDEALAALTRFDGAPVSALGEIELLHPLADSVCSAMYWQAPCAREALLDAPEVRAALLPVARALATAPGAEWWSSAVAFDRQHVVRWEHGAAHPDPVSASAALHGWSTRLAAEVRRELHSPEPLGGVSGSWWSAPTTHGLIESTRSLPPYDASLLFLVEECQGDFSSALVRPLQIDPDARVLEIGGAADWVALTRAHPLDVTPARRHDWWRVSGWSGRWLIPDWAAVAAEYDGVHLTVSAYLEGATRALPMDAAATMIAGWDPDATYWLTDAARPVGPARGWRQVRGGDQLDWAPNDHAAPPPAC